ncbi:MAG: MBL fold metallo-hydrolase [Chitinophagaceae bacterium]
MFRSLFIASIASGSNGNCYYVGKEREAVLIDVGISCREIVRRMQRLQLSMHKVKAVFISHEHSDHIRGLYRLAKKYQLPVFITSQTLQHCPFQLPADQVVSFQFNQTVSIGSLHITSFQKEHDVVDAHSFVVRGNEINVGVFTDIGKPCEALRYHFNQCHTAFLEANYDEELLHGGRYPIYLKRRISGGKGHLSNKQAVQLFQNYKPAHMSHLILSHLSQENNCPKLVEELFTECAGTTKVVVASRYQETVLYCITHNAVLPTVSKPQQMSLF